MIIIIIKALNRKGLLTKKDNKKLKLEMELLMKKSKNSNKRHKKLRATIEKLKELRIDSSDSADN